VNVPEKYNTAWHVGRSRRALAEPAGWWLIKK